MTVATTIVSDVRITKEDLIAIAISRSEQSLLSKEVDLAKRIKIARRELKESAKESTSLSLAQIRSEVLSKFDNVISELRNAHYEIKSMISVEKTSRTELEYTININESFSGQEYYRSRVNIVKSGTLVPSAEIIALLDKVDDLALEIDSIQAKRIAVKKSLRNLGTVERSAKAAIAMSVLKQSVEGRELIDQIDSMPLLTNLLE